MRRPDREEGAEAKGVDCRGGVPEFYEEGGGVVFDEEFEAAFGGLGHFALDGLVVDVRYSAGEACEAGTGGEGADGDGGVGLGWGPLG